MATNEQIRGWFATIREKGRKHLGAEAGLAPQDRADLLEVTDAALNIVEAAVIALNALTGEDDSADGAPCDGALADQIQWRRINDQQFEYAIQQGPHGDEFVKLLDGSCLRRPLSKTW